MGTSNATSEKPAEKLVTLEKALPFLVVVASLLLGLFLIEFPAMVRWVDYRGIVGPQREYFNTTKGDPELLFVRRPNAHISGTSRGGNIADVAALAASDIRQYRWDVTYDGNGFRNPSGLTKADIAVLGDSFVESPPIASDQLVTSVLARLEGKVAANFGQIGYGPGQESAALHRYALVLHPSTVVWMFYESNDLGDMLNYHSALRSVHAPPRFSDRSFLARSFTNNILLQFRRFATQTAGAALLRDSQHKGQGQPPPTFSILATF
jgi:hypothetical protein